MIKSVSTPFQIAAEVKRKNRADWIVSVRKGDTATWHRFTRREDADRLYGDLIDLVA